EFPMLDDLRSILEDQWTRRCDIQQRTGVVDPHVFIFFHGKKAGRRVKSFRRSFEASVGESGVGKLFHDFRRTAVRRSVRTPNIHQKVAMQLSGHKTVSVFQRYNIISAADLEAAREALNKAAAAEKGKVSGKVSPDKASEDTLSVRIEGTR